MHLDVEVEDIDSGRRQVEDLGGRFSGVRHDYDEGVVPNMLDPEGDVVRSTGKYPASIWSASHRKPRAYRVAELRPAAFADPHRRMSSGQGGSVWSKPQTGQQRIRDRLARSIQDSQLYSRAHRTQRQNIRRGERPTRASHRYEEAATPSSVSRCRVTRRLCSSSSPVSTALRNLSVIATELTGIPAAANECALNATAAALGR
ncbi:hypothetical protein [Mycolicibacterium moriokaense]|uniref:hypothetical protein n=1 Tax=Mycolicibacterium moriokaense TaxID=39691 RepID=UPI002ADE2BF1|nr:hypothetical protein [Mycolicibacterium moriokaense]